MPIATLLELAGSFAWKHWRMILMGAVVAAMSVMLVLAKSDARHWRKVSDQRAAALAIEVQKNGINLASIGALENALAMKSRESDARAKAYADSRIQDARDVAAADARQKADAGRISTLRGLARDLPDSGCKVPAVVAAQLKGL